MNGLDGQKDAVLSNLGVMIVEENNKTKWTTGHGLSWDERVFEGGLCARMNHRAQRQSCELQQTYEIEFHFF